MVDKIVGRKDTCPYCLSELRCYLNCRHYNHNSYNQCRESQADRVMEKDRSNFCDFSVFRDVYSPLQTKDDPEQLRKKGGCPV
jgi:hypothetical protein